jgi:hypothetical protein
MQTGHAKKKVTLNFLASRTRYFPAIPVMARSQFAIVFIVDYLPSIHLPSHSFHAFAVLGRGGVVERYEQCLVVKCAVFR